MSKSTHGANILSFFGVQTADKRGFEMACPNVLPVDFRCHHISDAMELTSDLICVSDSTWS
eukprot:3849467-Rhodomonas_salina.3